ncbi:hypothetical protein B0T16DRAFT_413311 [Cercophora newfieldiana]|uniref:Uncharacterized protein n=1 Tax=Cercophora newfieldiana TaxID=92897 RepID=A0AA39Y5N1_9PEZI|nr:hypothetical protein B0T16DRAFT_413311 [Cercophora newfieldiana]
MPDDESSNKNPFVRFKHHIDQRVSAGLQNIFGLPSIVSRTFAAGPGPARPDNTNPTAGKKTETTTAPPAPMGNSDSWPRPSNEDDAEPHVNPLQLAEDSKDHLASIMDSFVGASREEADMGWMLFLTRSPYSPLLLDRHLGWKPSPNARDPPASDSPIHGTWSDAFDDLLRASSSLPMKNPTQKDTSFPLLLLGALASPQQTADLAHQASTYLWQLKQNRLDEVLFPYHDRMFSYKSPRTMAEWVALRQFESESDPFAQLHGWVETLRKGEELWKKEVAPKIERIREVVMDEGPETEEDAYRAAGAGAVERRLSKEKEKQVLSKGWDDLFEVFKHIGEEEEKPREVRVISSWERTKPTWSGGTKTVSKKEYVDEDGAMHVETVVSVKNAEGQETSRRVSHSVRSESSSPDETQRDGTKQQHADGSDGREGVVPVKDETKPSGWFWSRR